MRGGTLAQFVEWTSAGQFPYPDDPQDALAALAAGPVTGTLCLISLASRTGSRSTSGSPTSTASTPSSGSATADSASAGSAGFDAYLAELAYLSDEAAGYFPASMHDQRQRHPELAR